MSDRLREEELEEVTNLISKKFIPEIIRIADTYNYDRDSLIKYVADLFSTMAEIATFENYNVSPVSNSENPNKWIPVSERSPKIADVYRVTRYYPNNVKSPKYFVDACFFDGSDTWYNDNRTNHERAYADNVIAWQENPEPYKGKASKT